MSLSAALSLALAASGTIEILGVEMGWREWSGVGVSCLVIYLSYALKESLQTRKHEHITRHGEGPTEPSPPAA